MNEPSVAVLPKRWTRDEYERAVAAGCFSPDERLELLAGEILVMTPQQSRHAATISLLERVLRLHFRAPCHIRIQMPLALTDDSEPEPDLAVVPGDPTDYLAAHPSTALLLVEVSDTTLAYDRKKVDAYGQAGIPECWIVNLRDQIVEVSQYVDPPRRYTATRDDLLIPLRGHNSDAPIHVADFLR